MGKFSKSCTIFSFERYSNGKPISRNRNESCMIDEEFSLARNYTCDVEFDSGEKRSCSISGLDIKEPSSHNNFLSLFFLN